MNYRAFLLLAAISASPALATAFADLAAIDRKIADFSGAQLGTPGGAALPVDRRLRLSQCSGPLALSWYGSQRETVLVECPAPSGWKVYVPLRIAARASAAGPIVARGDVVTVMVMGEGFSVSQPGEAMEPGALGAWIKVRQAGGKGDPVRAQVLRPGIVGIPLP